MKYFIFVLFLYPVSLISAPIITNISLFYTQDLLRFEAFYESQPVNFDPLTPGGWSFQLFMDTDQNNSTGWSGDGYDYMVRGVEQDVNGLIYVRKTMGGGGPGGWGIATGTIPLIVEENFFAFDVPLSFINYDAPELDFQLEIYNIVETPFNPTGITSHIAGFYEGTTPNAGFPNVGVPESSTLYLLGTGFIVLFGFIHSNKRRNRISA